MTSYEPVKVCTKVAKVSSPPSSCSYTLLTENYDLRLCIVQTRVKKPVYPVYRFGFSLPVSPVKKVHGLTDVGSIRCHPKKTIKIEKHIPHYRVRLYLFDTFVFSVQV